MIMNQFNEMRIQSKLFSIFGIMILLAAAITIRNVFSVIRMGVEAGELMDETLELSDIEEAQVYFLQQEVAEKNYLLSGNRYYLDKHDTAQALTELFLTESLLKAVDTQDTLLILDLQRQDDDYAEVYHKVITAYDKGDFAKANRISAEESSDHINAIHLTIERFVAEGEEIIEDKGRDADRQTYISLGLGVFGFVIFSLMAVFMIRVSMIQIGRPTLLINDAILAIGEGSFDGTALSEYAVRKDEIGQLTRAILAMEEAARNRITDRENQITQLKTDIAEAHQR